jgi:hypothetical protein
MMLIRFGSFITRVHYSSDMRLEFRDVQVRMRRTSIIMVPALACRKDWNSLTTMVYKCYELRAVFEALFNVEKFAHDLKCYRIQYLLLVGVCLRQSVTSFALQRL